MGKKANISLNARYHVSLNVLIPLIFTGISVLAVTVTYMITSAYAVTAMAVPGPLWLWAVAMGAPTFFCGLLITWLILRPVKRFVQEAEKLVALPKPTTGRQPNGKVKDEISHYTDVFNQVAEYLDRIEAKELFPNMVAQSKTMRSLMSQILKVAQSDSTVLITGESGTGKELIATSIYEHSLRKGKPFVKLNCIAIPEGLMESELFGHEKGAFTGATSQKPGKFEIADGGTILLDEIGDMPLATQAKLLRVLQEREFERVGGTRIIKVDVRIIVVTNKDLQKMMKEGQFREDLYFRLNVFSLHLPPLRERKEDISVLVDYFLAKAPSPVQISPLSLDRLLAYSWPGNVRELQNTLERAAVLAEDIIEPPHVAPLFGYDFSLRNENRDDCLRVGCIDDRLREIEKGMIVDALQKTGGVQAKAAQLLGINARSLWHRVKKYGIDAASFKSF